MSLQPARRYQLRNSATTVLHAVVNEYLPALLRDADERFPFGYPHHIAKTFRGYLRNRCTVRVVHPVLSRWREAGLRRSKAGDSEDEGVDEWSMTDSERGA